MAERQSKICASCGRRMVWRRRWARNWDRLRYCSAACRRRKVRRVDRSLETAILDAFGQRPRGATICPSEVARTVDVGSWRQLLEPTRRAARRLVAEGRLEIVQRGVVVDASTARGAVRFRLRELV